MKTNAARKKCFILLDTCLKPVIIAQGFLFKFMMLGWGAEGESCQRQFIALHSYRLGLISFLIATRDHQNRPKSKLRKQRNTEMLLKCKR